jgi:hypothetical protein
VGALKFTALLRYRCLLQMDNLQQMKWVLLHWLLLCVAALLLLASNGLAATNEVGAFELAASLPLRYRCLLQMDKLQQIKWVLLNWLLSCHCATAACFKWTASLRYRCLLKMD